MKTQFDVAKEVIIILQKSLNTKQTDGVALEVSQLIEDYANLRVKQFYENLIEQAK